MSTYNKSEIMGRAWKIFRAYPNLSFSQCLTRSWEITKENKKQISPVLINKILNGLKPFNRSRSVAESKPMMAGTQEHFKILNSKIGRRIMKRDSEDDSKQMLEQGILFAHDIIHQRRLESVQFTPTIKKQKSVFRNRIVNYSNCQKINIEDYV
jgi:hypothetical protein